MKLLPTDINFFQNAAVKHKGGYIAAAKFLLRLLQCVEDNPFLLCQPIADVGNIVKVTVNVEILADSVPGNRESDSGLMLFSGPSLANSSRH